MGRSLDEFLQGEWFELIGRLNPATDPLPSYKSIMVRYSEPGRYYHTASHIAHGLQVLEMATHLITHPDTVRYAFWLHDAVYVPGRSDNEANSAQVAIEIAATLGIKEEIVKSAADLILVTAQHDPQGIDQQVMVDADLSILGSPWKQFAAYEANIRREYEHVDPEQFRKGRLRILNAFIKRPSIYSIPLFKGLYEDQARRNLTQSISILENAGQDYLGKDSTNQPDAGIGILDHWREGEEPTLPEAGIGVFDHWLKPKEKTWPEAGIGLFEHYKE